MDPGDILLILGSFVPGLVYLFLVARYDREHRSPRRYLFGVYALGCFAVVPAVFLELAGGELIFGPIDDGASPTTMILASFFLIGPVEEVCKFLAVRSIYESPYFTDPLDGVVYSTAAAMGFASLENVFYVTELGLPTLGLRAILAIPGHLVFAAFWGYQLGRKKFGLGGNVLQGLALAAFAHGLYDALLMANVPWLGFMVVPLLIALLVIFRRQLRELWAEARTYSLGITADQRLLVCPCGARFPVEQERCTACSDTSPRLVCAACGKSTSWRHDRCAHCGIQFRDRAARCRRCGDPFPPHLDACPFCGQPVE